VPAFRHIYGEVSGEIYNGIEYWVYEYVNQLSSDKATFTMRDIKRSARRQLEGMTDQTATERIRDALYPLEQAGWVRDISESQWKPQWAVNPSIATDYSAHRQAVIEAKQRRIDQVAHGIGITPRKLS
jgi:hypothetical protein